jgi:hypothetical protein
MSRAADPVEEEVPRAPAPSEIYTRDEAVDRWRAICALGTGSRSEVKELLKIAQSLSIATRATTAKGLCAAIARHYQVAAAEPRWSPSPTLVAAAASSSPRRSPRRSHE